MPEQAEPPPLPSRLVAFVKRDCPTCELVEPVLAEIGERAGLIVYSQDDPPYNPYRRSADGTGEPAEASSRLRFSSSSARATTAPSRARGISGAAAPVAGCRWA